jgi:hypothetical protein
MMTVWYEIEWYDGNQGWRVAKRNLDRDAAIAQIMKWSKQYQCRLVRVEQHRITVGM